MEGDNRHDSPFVDREEYLRNLKDGPYSIGVYNFFTFVNDERPPWQPNPPPNRGSKFIPRTRWAHGRR